MQTVYIGNTLINDVMLGSQRMDDVLTALSSFDAEYLVIGSAANGGTGGGSPLRSGGGGGAGGLLSGSLKILPNVTYQIQVGWNDANNVQYASYLTGSNAYIFANGGGRGGRANAADSARNGSDGASGGGSAANVNGVGTAGNGTTGQGNNGGIAGGSNNSVGGGGGGAGSAGTNGVNGGAGGSGLASSITGTLITYSKGGNGSGGGDGVNYGDGGNGNNSGTAGRGKQGVVIIRYIGAQKFSGGTVTTDGNYTIHTFTTTNETIGSAYTRYSFTYQ